MTEMIKGVAEMILGPMRTKVQSKMMLSQEAQDLINKLINEFSHSSLRCQSMAYYFKEQERSLLGVADLHTWSSVSDAMWARSLVEYMNLRGGIVELDEIEAPEKQEWGDVAHSIECILHGKQRTYDIVLKLYKIAFEDSADPHLTDFLETNFVRPMVNIIRKVGILHSNALLVAADGGVGDYQFDKDVHNNLIKIITVNKLVRPDKFSVVY
jgi:ferritin